MNATTRFDLKMNIQEKEMTLHAATLAGITMAAFVRMAVKEKAQELLARESQITMSNKDFQMFTKALDSAFTPNAALKKAMKASKKVKRV